MKYLTQMLTFARVVDAGSFAGAARELGVNTSVTSKHVSALEQHLGMRLLVRGSRRLQLTAAGRTYAEHCRRIAVEIAQARDTVTQMQSVPRGRLRVSGPPGMMAELVVPWLAEFRRRYPAVELDLFADERMIDLADEGYDLALRVTDQLPAQAVARKLADMRLAVCASPDYVERHGAPVEPMDLLAHDCLQFTPPGLMSGAVFEKDGVRVDVPVHGIIRFNHVEPLHLLARAGLGVALLPRHLLQRDLVEGRLVRLLPDWRPVVDAALYAVYLPNRYGLPKLRVFVDFLLEKFEPARRPR